LGCFAVAVCLLLNFRTRLDWADRPAQGLSILALYFGEALFASHLRDGLLLFGWGSRFSFATSYPSTIASTIASWLLNVHSELNSKPKTTRGAAFVIGLCFVLAVATLCPAMPALPNLLAITWFCNNKSQFTYENKPSQANRSL
jgi:hypothetical protein